MGGIMRLRNKKTWEIGYLHSDSDGKVQVARSIGYNYKYYDTLTELAEEWEDLTEDPKEYWHIFGTNITKTQEGLDEIYDKRNKEIGNYFSSEEEARRAVEKLKAFTRLKDKGFRFDYVGDYEFLCGNGFEVPIRATIPPEFYEDEEVKKDLIALFGGEE